MFLGEYKYSLDPKSRIFIPAKLRCELGDEFYISEALLDKCLRIYPKKEWETLTETIFHYPEETARAVRRKVFSTASANTLDSQGRTLIPQVLLDYAKITKDVYILGVGKYLEIWDKETLDDLRANEDDSALEKLLLDLEKNGQL